MGKRIKIGIPHIYNKNWIAGTYYIANLISAFNLLVDEKKPYITIYFNKDNSCEVFKETGYPYLKLEKIRPRDSYNLFQRLVNKISRTISQKNVFENRPRSRNLNVLFPTKEHFYFELIPLKKKLYWIPDFQEYFLPEFFTEDEIAHRKNLHKKLVINGANIVLSSNSSLNDFKKIFPKADFSRIHVLPFAVFIKDSYKRLDANELFEKYSIKKPYFICSNQFWAHKSHITVLKALTVLKERGILCRVVFTGKTEDYRQPDFFKTLMDYINKNKLEQYVFMLGMIDREEQLKLLSESIAIIQPSLFEGWSTVVEDSKTMNKHIILSDLDVHKEQINENAIFFERLNYEELARIMQSFLDNNIVTRKIDYQENRVKFAEDFNLILKRVYKNSSVR